MRGLWAGCLLLLSGCAAVVPLAPGPLGVAEGPWRQQSHGIPLMQADGTVVTLLGRVCRPPGEKPGRVVVIAHGSPSQASARPGMQPAACDSEAVRWFLARGDVVVLSMRRGYGGTGGVWVEGVGNCSVDSYVRSARVSAQDVAATVDYALTLPYARPDGAIVVGQSAGGWASVGLNSLPHQKVAAIVSMAGGRGGHVNEIANNNCMPDNMAVAAGRLGATATTPMLWVYAANDSFFAPAIATATHAAFIGAGGKAELQQPGAFAKDGHGLFFGRGGSLVWGPLVERYLAERGAS